MTGPASERLVRRVVRLANFLVPPAWRRFCEWQIPQFNASRNYIWEELSAEAKIAAILGNTCANGITLYS